MLVLPVTDAKGVWLLIAMLKISRMTEHEDFFLHWALKPVPAAAKKKTPLEQVAKSRLT